MIPIAQSRLIQIPAPRLAKKNVSGIEINLTSTRIVAIEPIEIATRLSGTLPLEATIRPVSELPGVLAGWSTTAGSYGAREALVLP